MPDREPLPLDVALQINRVSDEFEDACRSGQAPRIEEYLDRVPVVGRLQLLETLLVVEFERCRNEGKPVAAEVYRQRFPGCDSVIRAAMAASERHDKGAADHTIDSPGPRGTGADQEPLPADRTVPHQTAIGQGRLWRRVPGPRSGTRSPGGPEGTTQRIARDRPATRQTSCRKPARRRSSSIRDWWRCTTCSRTATRCTSCRSTSTARILPSWAAGHESVARADRRADRGGGRGGGLRASTRSRASGPQAGQSAGGSAGPSARGRFRTGGGRELAAAAQGRGVRHAGLHVARSRCAD